MLRNAPNQAYNFANFSVMLLTENTTLESGIDIGQGISVGPGKFVKKNKRRALNTHVLYSK